MCSHSSYYGYSPFPTNVAGSPVSVASARCFRNGYLVRIHRAWSLFPILSMFSLTVHLADTRPHSHIAYGSIADTSSIGITHAIYREVDHAPTCAYRLLSFPICHAYALNPPCITASAAGASTHSLSVSLYQPLAIMFPLSPNTARCPLLFVHGGRQNQATCRAHQARAQRQQLQHKSQPKSHSQHHYEYRYEYDSVRCHSIIVIALFAYAVVSHDNSIVTSK